MRIRQLADDEGMGSLPNDRRGPSFRWDDERVDGLDFVYLNGLHSFIWRDKMALMWLFEMLEDGEPSDDWPAITFRLDTFGQLIKREVKLHEIPIGFRISAQERPIIPGMEWVAKPMSWPVGEGPPEQTWAAMRIGLGPTCITYSICREKKHIHIEETRAEGRRTARLVGTAVCTTNHKEHVERIAVELDQLPPTTQQILAEIDSKSGVPGFVRRVLASLGL